jgi:hypothetical protein
MSSLPFPLPSKHAQYVADAGYITNTGEHAANTKIGTRSTPVDKSKGVSVKLTKTECENMIVACYYIQAITTNQALKAYIAANVGIPFNDIEKKISHPILKVQAKTVKSDENARSTKKTSSSPTYFTKPVNVNDAIRHMCNNMGVDVSGLSLRYDQIQHTCPFDVRAIVKEYIRANNLESQHGIRVDTFMSSVLKDRENINTIDNTQYIDMKYNRALWKIVKAVLRAV